MSTATHHLRASLRRTASLRRRSSSSLSPKVTLPPAKMRSLVSLYHQAETFITPQNLSTVIDYEFIYRRQKITSLRSDEDSFYDLQAELASRKIQPKIGEANQARTQSETSRDWSEKRSERENKVVNALYGTDGGRPGFDVLEEEADYIKDLLRRDDNANRSA
ncbi:hypothetical protein IEO21_00674 [Rhodonia placenta]|uniref:Uncharacterized protein n=1 Tax=Rhodonia placenta TaxID=104341 RepID=A0A8H7PB19_9APHY|nr:hypothetical protein IEO21_00674 [Postia placenta]